MNSRLEKLIHEEAEYAWAHRDDPPPDPLPPGTTVRYLHKAQVLSVRLLPQDYDRLVEQAKRKGFPVSTEARYLILAGLNDAEDEQDKAYIKAVVTQALRENLVPEVLAA